MSQWLTDSRLAVLHEAGLSTSLRAPDLPGVVYGVVVLVNKNEYTDSLSWLHASCLNPGTPVP